MVKRIGTTAEEKVSTSFKIPKSLRKELKIAAARDDREMSELVADALRAYLRTHGGQK
jgi:metal-responsive CopG/Arc/MetJ family transcriptional regulator